MESIAMGNVPKSVFRSAVRWLFAVGLSLAFVIGLGFTRAEASLLDTSFGDQGVVHGASLGSEWTYPAPGDFFETGVNEISFTPDGQIFVGQQGNIVKLSGEGVPDPGFGESGVVDIRTKALMRSSRFVVRSLISQRDGKVIAAGYAANFRGPQASFMFRLNPDGSLDREFGYRDSYMFYRESFGGAAVDGRGRIVVTGSYGYYGVMVRRFTRRGLIDRSFGKNGVLRIRSRGKNLGHMLHSVMVLPSKRILAAGTIRNRPVIVAVRPSGRIDRRFGVNGFAWGPKARPEHCRYDRSEACAVGDLVRLSDGRFVLGSTLNMARSSNGRASELSWYDALIAFRQNGRRAKGYASRGVRRFSADQISRAVGRPAWPHMIVNDVVPLSRGRVFVLGLAGIKGIEAAQKIGVLIDRRGQAVAMKEPLFMGQEHRGKFGGAGWASGAAAVQPDGRVLIGAWEDSYDEVQNVPSQAPALFRIDIPR